MVGVRVMGGLAIRRTMELFRQPSTESPPMEKVDVLLAKVSAMEVMLTALAASAPNRADVLAQFELGVSIAEGQLLASQATEEFVQEFLTQTIRFRALISSEPEQPGH